MQTRGNKICSKNNNKVEMVESERLPSQKLLASPATAPEKCLDGA
jgi:hypothetical protein